MNWRLASIVCFAGIVLVGCDDVAAPTNPPLSAERLKLAQQAQGGNKAKNGGGVFQANDPPAPPGVKTGPPETGSKLKDRDH
jgi:hypothetical protein